MICWAEQGWKIWKIAKYQRINMLSKVRPKKYGRIKQGPKMLNIGVSKPRVWAPPPPPPRIHACRSHRILRAMPISLSGHWVSHINSNYDQSWFPSRSICSVLNQFSVLSIFHNVQMVPAMFLFFKSQTRHRTAWFVSWFHSGFWFRITCFFWRNLVSTSLLCDLPVNSFRHAGLLVPGHPMWSPGHLVSHPAGPRQAT